MSARDDLARLIFITDNANAKDPAAEWEGALADDAIRAASTDYAYAIADGLLAAGVTMPVPRRRGSDGVKLTERTLNAIILGVLVFGPLLLITMALPPGWGR